MPIIPSVFQFPWSEESQLQAPPSHRPIKWRKRKHKHCKGKHPFSADLDCCEMPEIISEGMYSAYAMGNDLLGGAGTANESQECLLPKLQHNLLGVKIDSLGLNHAFGEGEPGPVCWHGHRSIESSDQLTLPDVANTDPPAIPPNFAKHGLQVLKADEETSSTGDLEAAEEVEPRKRSWPRRLSAKVAGPWLRYAENKQREKAAEARREMEAQLEKERRDCAYEHDYRKIAEHFRAWNWSKASLNRASEAVKPGTERSSPRKAIVTSTRESTYHPITTAERNGNHSPMLEHKKKDSATVADCSPSTMQMHGESFSKMVKAAGMEKVFKNKASRPELYRPSSLSPETFVPVVPIGKLQLNGSRTW